MIYRSKAPLRLGLIGGGTDVSPYCDKYGGYVLNATIDMYSYCTIEVTSDNKVSFCAADLKKEYENDSVSYLKDDGIFNLHIGIYNYIVKHHNNNEPLSLKMTTYSDAPVGSGLGGSSTMVVVILKTYFEWLNIPLGEYEIARIAFQIERIELDIIGGAQDHYAATFGGFNFMEFYENNRVIVNPLRIKSKIINELESSLVLYFTNITRRASIIEEEKSNTIEKVEKSLNAMHSVKEDSFLMKEALLKGDFVTFADVLGHSWESKKKMAKTVTNKKIDEIYEKAISSGAVSGKVSGAGGGGFMFFFVDPLKKFALVEELNKLEGRAINFHFTKNGTTSWTI